MQFTNLALVFGLAAMGSTMGLSARDTPQQCTNQCTDVVRMAQDCDRNTNDDRAELDCICSSSELSKVPDCEACVRQYDDDDDTDGEEDIFQSYRICSARSSSASNSPQATSSQGSANNSPATTSGGSAATSAAGTFSLANPTASVNNAPAEQSTGAAAPMQTAGVGFVAAGLGLGLGAVFGGM